MKFVQIRAEDAEEFQPFEQRPTRVTGLVEHTLVEREPRQLAIDVKIRIAELGFFFVEFGRHGSRVPRT